MYLEDTNCIYNESYKRIIKSPSYLEMCPHLFDELCYLEVLHVMDSVYSVKFLQTTLPKIELWQTQEL